MVFPRDQHSRDSGEQKLPLGSRESEYYAYSKEAAEAAAPSYNKLGPILLMAGGAALLARSRNRSFIEALDYIGGLGRRAQDNFYDPLTRAIDDGLNGATTQTARKVGGRWRNGERAYRATPELIRDLERLDENFGAVGPGWTGYRAGGNRRLRDVALEHLNVKYGAAREPSADLFDVTVEDVLNNQSIREQFHERDISVLRRGLETGVVSRRMRVSSGDLGLMRDSSYRVLDTAWASPKNFLDIAHQATSGFRISGFSPSDFVFGLARPFINQPISTTIGNSNKTTPRILPNGVRTGSILNVGIGDEIFSLRPGEMAFDSLGRGFRLHDTSVPGTRWVARAADAMSGDAGRYANATLLKNQPDPEKNPWKYIGWKVQEALGVGPAFSVRESSFGRLRDAFVRLRSMRKGGPGEFKGASYIRAQDAQGFFARSRLGKQLGENAETAIPNIYKREWKDLSIMEKIEAYFGTSRLGKIKSGVKAIDEGYVHVPRTPEGRTTVGLREPLKVGVGGYPSIDKAASGVATMNDRFVMGNLFAHHATTRLNELIGFTFGLGFRPSAGALGWATNLAKIYGIHYAATTGLEYLKYADYLVESATGVSPSNLAVGGYTRLMEYRQSLREKTGIAPAARYMEGLMPGSIESAGSWLMRTVAAPVVGAIKGGVPGFMAGILGVAAIGGGDVGQTPEELHRIYTGDKLEPVRRGRWWVLGNQPWAGDKISYYRPNWAARFINEPQYTDTQYGSKKEYFMYGSEAPTPHNLFGILKLASPDHYAEKHEENRPYPFSATGVPMHVGEDVAPYSGTAAAQAAQLGLESNFGTYNPGVDPTTFNARFNRGLNQLTELGGAYKFLAESLPFYDDIFGSEKTNEKYAADASTITSGSRRYYDEEVGGLLGMSELTRRFLDEAKGKQGINRIPNTMPDWLPGARSAYAEDQGYPVDFTLGDPYARVPGGEYRLPGPGYESVRPLHSGIPGVYDPMDRFLILADVAPGSQAYREYKTIVESWVAGNALDLSWRRKYEETEVGVRERLLGGDWFAPRRFSGVISGTVEQLATINTYSEPEKVIGAAWEVLTHDVVPGLGKTVPIFGNIFDKKLFGQRSAYEAYLEEQVYGTSWQDWKTPYESFVRPKYDTLMASNPLVATAGGIGLGTMFGPVGAVVGGIGFGLGSAGRAAVTGQWSGGYIPDHVEERWALQEYFDVLQYTRLKRAEKLARDQGQTQLATDLMYEARKTTVGFDYNRLDERFDRTAPFRMGRPMRPYARAFLASPQESMTSIMDVIQPMNQDIIESSFARRHGGFRYRPTVSANERAQRILDYYGEPEEDWEGWNISTPLSAVKVKTLDTVSNQAHDMHYHDVYAADKRYAESNFRGLDTPISRLPTAPRATMVVGDRVERSMNVFSMIEDMPEQVIDYTQNTVRSIEQLLTGA